MESCKGAGQIISGKERAGNFEREKSAAAFRDPIRRCRMVNHIAGLRIAHNLRLPFLPHPRHRPTACPRCFFRSPAKEVPRGRPRKPVRIQSIDFEPGPTGPRDLARSTTWPCPVPGVVGVGPGQDLLDLDRPMDVDPVPIELGQELAHEVVERRVPLQQFLSVPATEIPGLDPIPVFRAAKPHFLFQPTQVAAPILRRFPKPRGHATELPLAPVPPRDKSITAGRRTAVVQFMSPPPLFRRKSWMVTLYQSSMRRYPRRSPSQSM